MNHLQRRMPIVTRFLLPAVACAWLTGCAYVGHQGANIAPIRDLPPAAASVDSLLPLFPSAVRMRPGENLDPIHPLAVQVMIAGGTHLGVNEPSRDGVRDCVILTWPEQPGGFYRGARAELSLYTDRSQADAHFELDRRHPPLAPDTSAGSPGDRYALSKVRQGVSDTWQRLDLYHSQAVFQKGAVVVTITETSSDPAGSLKDRLIEQIAHAFKREPLAPEPWGGR